MRSFHDFESLRSFLQKDQATASLTPVRFLNVESMEAWNQVKPFLLFMAGSHLGLSEYCEGEDTMPNLRRLLARLKAGQESVCVSPLSEYLRVKPEIAKQEITEILSKEYSTDGKRRIYFPMYRMKSVLQALPDHDPRKKNCVIFLETGEDSDYSLTILQKELNVRLPGNELYGFQRYLQYWEQNPDKPLILHTSNAVYLEEHVFFDRVRVIVDAFDLLAYHFDLPRRFHKQEGSTEQWNTLLRIVEQAGNFQNACYTELQTDSFHIHLFSRWNHLSAFQRWILWLWTRIQSEEGYVISCAKNSLHIAEFVDNLYCKIINLLGATDFSAAYDERKQILSGMRISPPAAFQEKERQLANRDALRILTDSSEWERNRILERIREIPFGRHSELLSVLYRSWPPLAYYLRNQDEDIPSVFSEAYCAYFAEYRWLKVTDTLTPHFMDLVRQTAIQKGAGVYQMESRGKLVAEAYQEEDSAIFFVDGLGIEYLDYLWYILSPLKRMGFSIAARAGYCNLPSVTETNKDFLTGRRVAASLTEFDMLKHGTVQYPDTIIREMEFLRSLREKIELCFDHEIHRIILTADHGASRLAVSVRKSDFDRKLSLPDGTSACRHGRYCEGVEMADQYSTAIECDGKLIFADYTRFEQKGAPTNEIHGGASLEEWLVPVIVIEKKRNAEKDEQYHVRVKTPSVRPDSYTKMAAVALEITPCPKDGCKVSVQIHGKTVNCTFDSGTYTFRYKPESGENLVQAVVMVNGSAYHAEFSVIRGIAENSKFQI